MPSTYTLISSNVLTSSAASVTFSAIPSTYTDLVLRCSVRCDQASGNLALTLNGSTSNFSYTRLRGDGSAAASFRSTFNYFGNINGTAHTSNTFTNAEVYLPNYQVSANKPMSSFTAQEDNATSAYITAVANLWSNTAAITSVTVNEYSGYNFVSGSSFYLYGIKNS